MRKNLEERLIIFASEIISITNKMNDTYAARYYAGQIIRSSGSSAMNYAEAQGAESRKDFIHKISIVLKELREALISLQIIQASNLSSDKERISDLLEESNQLVSIFYQTAKTARNNLNKLKEN